MKLQFGLTSPSPIWEAVLRQEGVPFMHVDLEQDSLAEVTVLIVTREAGLSGRRAIESYLRSGGAVLGYAAYLVGLGGIRVREEEVDYLLPERLPRQPDLRILDLATVASIPGEANMLRSQNNSYAMFVGEISGGYAVLLPFDVNAALGDSRNANRNFYSTRSRLPAERVSRVAKGEVRHLLRWAFEHLHRVQGLPYAHLWYFQGGKKNLFAFRVDTDRGSKKEVDELHHVARDFEIGMSWFLDVKSHEGWLDRFATLAGQEMGVHCYEHQVYPTYEENLRNITLAKKRMEAVGMQPSGFSAPFGMWNGGLAKALDEIGFEYSSEFGFAYDTLPFHPITTHIPFKTPQVPIHPISIGSLKRVGYSDQQMKEYYRRVIDEKVYRAEPLFFYHHPTHGRRNVVAFVFEYVRQQGIENTTFGDYALWWKKRIALRYQVEHGKNVVHCVIENDAIADDVWIRIVSPNGSETVAPLAGPVNLKMGMTSQQGALLQCPEDLRRVRDGDARTLVADWYTTMARRIR